MNNKLLGGIVFFVVFFCGCKPAPDKNVKISGTFSNLSDAQLYVYQLLPASQPLIDSVRTDHSGNFSITLLVQRTGFYILRYKADNEIILIITPGEDIKLTGDGASLSTTYSVKGSLHSGIYAEYNQFTANNLKKVDSLSIVFAQSREKPDFLSIKNQLDEAYLSIFDKQKEEVIAFANNHLNSLASLLAVSKKFGPNPLLSEKSHPDLFLKLDSALVIAYPENSFVNALHLRMLEYKADLGRTTTNESLLKPGQPAPEIELPDARGKTAMLSSSKGKLVLVYFWSSWNALSRQTNINLTTIYNRYHAKGFEIYAVSLDSDTSLWQRACLIDKAYWIHVIDIKGLTSEYSRKYNVNSLPCMILIDRAGTIIVRDPEQAELDGFIKKNL